MIERLTSYDGCAGFIAGFFGDPEYSDPMLSSEEQVEVNLKKAFGRPDDRVWGVTREGVMTGLFVFLVLDDERYMRTGPTRSLRTSLRRNTRAIRRISFSTRKTASSLRCLKNAALTSTRSSRRWC